MNNNRQPNTRKFEEFSSKVESNKQYFYKPATLEQEDFDFYIKGIKSDNMIEKNDRIDDIYREFSPKIINHVTQNNGTVQDAMNIFQDTVMTLLLNSYKETFELTAKLGTYLHSIWKNKWLKELDKRKKKKVISLENLSLDIPDTTSSYSEDELIKDFFVNILETTTILTEKRTTIFQYMLEGKRNQEIADILDMTPGGVAQAKKHILRIMRKFILSDPNRKNFYENWKNL